MKKLLTILLLTTHLMNLVGFGWLFQFIIVQADRQLNQQLDNHYYSDSDLMEIAVHLNLPYTSNWHEYERVSGEMEVNGIQYNYVKRKLQNDTLYLMCIRNVQKTQLCEAKNSLQKQLNGNPANKKDNSQVVKKINFTDDYNFRRQHQAGVEPAQHKEKTEFLASALPAGFIQGNERPPIILC